MSAALDAVNKALADLPDPPEQILKFFKSSHLPVPLQLVAQPFEELADTIVSRIPRSEERTVALRKLLESKDAAVRASLP